MNLIDRDRYQKDLLSAYDDLSIEFDVLDNQPTVQAIPLDKIKQTREKIWKNVYEYSGSGNEVIQAYCDGFKASLKILDKLIEESEVEE